MICHLLVVQMFLKPSEKRRLSKVWYLDNAYFEGSSGAKKEMLVNCTKENCKTIFGNVVKMKQYRFKHICISYIF